MSRRLARIVLLAALLTSAAATAGEPPAEPADARFNRAERLLTAGELEKAYELYESLAKSAALEASERVNPPENARLTFDQTATEKMQDMIDTNFKFYKQVNDNPEFARYFLNWLFTRYQRRAKSA